MVVSLQAISNSFGKAVTEELRNLGANILVIPRSLSAANFYTADYGQADMPESYFYKLTGSGLMKEEAVEAQLSARIKVGDHQAILTGVMQLPEISSAKKHIFLGNEIAKLLQKVEGEEITIKGEKFAITKILAEKGTIDDIRIFAQLSTVQKLLRRGRTINLLEVMGQEISGKPKLAEQIEVLLLDTNVVTKEKITRTRESTIRALRKYSLLLLVVVLLVGGINIANYMFINVRERRREIGILLAIGATPKIILKVFLQKAVLLGLTGGLTGYIFGAFLAVSLGPQIVKVRVSPTWGWCIWAMISAVILSVVSSIIPAKRAANLDPAEILQEE